MRCCTEYDLKNRDQQNKEAEDGGSHGGMLQSTEEKCRNNRLLTVALYCVHGENIYEFKETSLKQ